MAGVPSGQSSRLAGLFRSFGLHPEVEIVEEVVSDYTSLLRTHPFGKKAPSFDAPCEFQVF